MNLPGAAASGKIDATAERRYVDYFHELDAWTEYWDIYNPETKGRFYFGDGVSETGLLTRLLPRHGRPPVFIAWTRMALGLADPGEFAAQARVLAVQEAIEETDGLLDRVYRTRFGDPADPAVRADYLEAMFRFASNTLPPATVRGAKPWAAPPVRRIESAL